MSELQNPLFDEEKEFLERKKLEYERALRGDVEHIKEQSATVGKVALVGAGLAGTVWLIAKAFGGKKHKHRDHDDDQNDRADEAPAKRGKPGKGRKSAAASAAVFMDHYGDADHEFGGGVARPAYTPQSAPIAAQPVGALANAATRPTEKNLPAKTPPAPPAAPTPKAADKPAPPRPAPTRPTPVDEDPFQDLPYDDSRRLPASRAFDADAEPAKGVPTPAMAATPRSSVARVVGSVLQQFLQSDTGKVLVAQAGALALAAVTKKAGEFFPADKNADLAASSDAAPAQPTASAVASSAPSASPDASKSPQSA